MNAEKKMNKWNTNNTLGVERKKNQAHSMKMAKIEIELKDRIG